MNWLKSIGAVAAGFLTVVVLSIGLDFVFESLGTMPPANRPELLTDAGLILPTAYRVIVTVLGGYVTARLAPARPVLHALILGGIGTLAALAGMFAMWGFGHHWYAIALVVTALPCCWLGARFVGRRAAA